MRERSSLKVAGLLELVIILTNARREREREVTINGHLLGSLYERGAKRERERERGRI